MTQLISVQEKKDLEKRLRELRKKRFPSKRKQKERYGKK